MLDTSNMGMTWPEFKQSSVELDRQAKRESREFELYLLERRGSKFDTSLWDDMIELERKHRKWLDREIDRKKKELMELK